MGIKHCMFIVNHCAIGSPANSMWELLYVTTYHTCGSQISGYTTVKLLPIVIDNAENAAGLLSIKPKCHHYSMLVGAVYVEAGKWPAHECAPKPAA